MTDEEINIKIAEACGWHYYDGWKHEDGREDKLPYGPPNYCSDLNAMHEAEKVLTLKRLLIYAEWLESEYGFFGITATARQRAEALLCTLGKWEKAK
jgi:hypothetical protein